MQSSIGVRSTGHLAFTLPYTSIVLSGVVPLLCATALYLQHQSST